MPKVSIIVPNYNHAIYLQQRLDSIFNQTYQDFEVIMLDDASADNSVKILTAYRDMYPEKVSNLIINDKNSGSPFKQWRKGIELANGEYLWIAESDDFCKENFLEICIPVLRNTGICLAFTNTTLVDCINNKQSVLTNGILNGFYDAIENRFLENWFFKNNKFRITNASACVFKKSMLEKKWMDEIGSYNYGGDKFLWTNLLMKNENFYFCQEPINFQRYHNSTTRADNTTRAKFLKSKEILSIYEIFYKSFHPYSKGTRNEIGHNYLFTAYLNLKVNRQIHWTYLFKGINFSGIDIRVYYKVIKKALLDFPHVVKFYRFIKKLFTR